METVLGTEKEERTERKKSEQQIEWVEYEREMLQIKTCSHVCTQRYFHLCIQCQLNKETLIEWWKLQKTTQIEKNKTRKIPNIQQNQIHTFFIALRRLATRTILHHHYESLFVERNERKKIDIIKLMYANTGIWSHKHIHKCSHTPTLLHRPFLHICCRWQKVLCSWLSFAHVRLVHSVAICCFQKLFLCIASLLSVYLIDLCRICTHKHNTQSVHSNRDKTRKCT